MSDSDLKVIIAAHKPYWMPEDSCYVPIQVGSAGKETILSFRRDDEGDNISVKNPNYCELTGLYWAWKHLDADYLGLAHYRRHFASKSSGDKENRVATREQLMDALHKAPVVLPKKRNYFIETNYSQYVHAHHAEDLEMTREILAAMEPAYLDKYDEVMKRTYGHRFNMFIMRRDLADAWCEWLFNVLFELENRLDISGYSQNDARVFGFVSERLIDVWLEANNISYVELPVVNLEDQHWVKKGAAFLGRKLSSGKKEMQK